MSTQRIHATMHLVKPSKSEAVVDPTGPKAERQQLASCDDTMLAGRRREDGEFTWFTLSLYFRVNVHHVRHAAHDPTRAANSVRRT
jgi:hypothetical protein